MSWYGHDQVGSVVDVFNPAGQLAASFEYSPYGQLRGPPLGAPAASASVKTLLGYAGLSANPAGGGWNMRARQYDPATGRFASADPLGQAGSASPLGAYGSVYAYALGNPLLYTDPTGMYCFFGLNPDGSCRGSGMVHDVASSVAEAAGVMAAGVAIAGVVCGVTVVCLPAAAVLEVAAGTLLVASVSAKAVAFATEDPSDVASYVGFGAGVVMDVGPGKIAKVVYKPLKGYTATTQLEAQMLRQEGRLTSSLALDGLDAGVSSAQAAGDLLTPNVQQAPQACQALPGRDLTPRPPYSRPGQHASVPRGPIPPSPYFQIPPEVLGAN